MYKRSNTPHKGQRLSGPANPNDDIPSKEGPSGSRYVEKLPRLSRRARLRSPSVHTDNSSVAGSPSPPPGPRFRQQLKTIIDWRSQLCDFLSLSTDATDDDVLKGLDDATEKLEIAERFTSLPSESQSGLPPRYQVINRVDCLSSDEGLQLYLEEPWVVNSGPLNAHLRGSQEIDNFEVYLERNKDISFIVYRDYQCCSRERVIPRGRFNRPSLTDASSLLTNESISIILVDLSIALEAIATEALSGIPHPSFDLESELNSPFLWWFHRREEIKNAWNQLDPMSQEHISTLQDYLVGRLGSEWSTVDSLIAEGKISAQYIEYLFVPQSIVISQSNGGKPTQSEAFKVTSWLNFRHTEDDYAPKLGGGIVSNFSGDIEGISWKFDGNFQTKKTMLPIHSLLSATGTFDIKELAVYPIKFADIELQKALRARGETFWKCRRRNYVCYNSTSDDGIQNGFDQRFMVDIATFKQMHPPDPQKAHQIPLRDEIGSHVMDQDEPPPDDDFIMCLPTTIPGFNMQKKEWVSLEVSSINPVIWNTAAFDTLVVDPETKELVSALVTNQIDIEKSTDLMSGKGNGLFILLHGGPGTGKTLTAESVAEFAEKPLYRVTCGDIGTKAEEVEKYLELVLLLGKTWGCVVLLDEADVFLEQRTLFDLQRNALVSVFLRVLEYYDGILILTSNRVGTFDEAFKSRIQLTLRYKNLEAPQRLKIWDNFISRLESFQTSPQGKEPLSISNTHAGVDLGINVVEIRKMLPKLAEAKLNGREIRNAVSTARQLAMFQKKPMGYKHLESVIEEAKKFDTYLVDLRKGFTADEIKKHGGER